MLSRACRCRKRRGACRDVVSTPPRSFAPSFHTTSSTARNDPQYGTAYTPLPLPPADTPPLPPRLAKPPVDLSLFGGADGPDPTDAAGSGFSSSSPSSSSSDSDSSEQHSNALRQRKSLPSTSQKEDEQEVDEQHKQVYGLDRRDFLWSMTEEPHRSRRLAILKAHPEVRRRVSFFLACSALLEHALSRFGRWEQERKRREGAVSRVAMRERVDLVSRPCLHRTNVSARSLASPARVRPTEGIILVLPLERAVARWPADASSRVEPARSS